MYHYGVLGSRVCDLYIIYKQLKASENRGVLDTKNSPKVDSRAPIMHHTALVMDYAAPVGICTAPIMDYTVSVENSTAPVVESTAPVVEYKALEMASTAPVMNNAIPNMYSTAPVLGSTAPEKAYQGNVVHTSSHMGTKTNTHTKNI